MPISQEQLDAIKAQVETLVADKADADTKTQAANAAVTAAKLADAAAAQANLDEAQADAKASADLQALSHFLDTLVAPDPVITVAPAQ